MPAISEGKKCETTHPGDPQELEDYYIKDFEWTNISSDQMMSMFTNTGIARRENRGKRVLLNLLAPRRILELEVSPSNCTVEKCRFSDTFLTNDQIISASTFSRTNLKTERKYASGLRFESSSGKISMIKVRYTDLETDYVVYPRMSIPVTNYVKVWDSYSKTCINKGSASRAYLVGNDPPEGNDSKHHLYNDRDFNGIRCDTKGGFHRKSTAESKAAYIAIFFGFRIRVCTFLVSMPNKAPANLALYMDGNEIAKVTANAPDKVVDLLDWYTGSQNPNDLFGSSFKLVWPTSNDTEAHLTRITISYTEPGSPIKHWKSTQKRKNQAFSVSQIQHPSAKKFGRSWNSGNADRYIESTLCTPGKRWIPKKGTLEAYGSSSSWPGAISFMSARAIHLTAFVINFPDYGEKVDDSDNDDTYRERPRNSGMKLVAYSQKNSSLSERIISELGNGQITAGRLNLLDYRKTNYLSNIIQLDLLFDIRNERDDYENVINSVDIFYFNNEFTPQKVWESTNRLKDSFVPLASYIGADEEAILTVNDTNRYYGHTKQMMTEGFPHYWKSRDTTPIDITFSGEIVMTSFIFETCRTYRKHDYRRVKLKCKDQIICETPNFVGSGQGREAWTPGDYIDMFDHKKVKHMPFLTGNKFSLHFPGTAAVGKISIGYYDVHDEYRDSRWVPGDFGQAQFFWPKTGFEMMNLNSNPLTFWSSSSTSHLDIRFKERVYIKNVVLGADILTNEFSSTLYPQPEIDMHGRSKANHKSNFQNITLYVDNGIVASTNQSFVLQENQTHIHFFEYEDNEGKFLDSWIYRQNVNYRRLVNGIYCSGASVKLEFGNSQNNTQNNNENYSQNNYNMGQNNYNVGLNQYNGYNGFDQSDKYGNQNYPEGPERRVATLEIIYSNIVPSDLKLAERSCLAAHNIYRLRHGLSWNYYLSDSSLRTSARNFAQTLLNNNKFEHSAAAKRGEYGENLFRIKWLNGTSPSYFDKLAVAGEAVEQWYSEYVNYDKSTGESNGNIHHDGQIGHFLQMLCKDGGKIGIGIKSAGTTTIVCVHYKETALSMNKKASHISLPSYVGADSMLTIQEEAELRKVIATGRTKLSAMTNTQKEKLYMNCMFYLKQARHKLSYMENEANDQYTDIIENGYSKNEWKEELKRIGNLVSAAYRKNSSQLNTLTADISNIRIPNSLAETSFRDLQLTGFFLDMIDVLGLSILVNGDTPLEAIIASKTITEIITGEDNTLDGNGYKDVNIDYHDTPTDNKSGVKKCIRVMLGLFGIQTGTASTKHWYSNDKKFKDAWEKIIRRLKYVFGNSKAPKAILLNYNGFNGDGINMSAEYATTCKKEKHTSQELKVQYDIIS